MTAGRASRTSIEIIVLPDATPARASRTSLEAILAPDSTPARASRVSLEVILQFPSGIGPHWGIPWK